MRPELQQRIFEDIGHIKATQDAILSLQKRIEHDFFRHESRLSQLEKKVTRIFAYSSALITIISSLFAFIIKI